MVIRSGYVGHYDGACFYAWNAVRTGQGARHLIRSNLVVFTCVSHVLLVIAFSIMALSQ